jgi:asparagine synthase (glutamine-hydrolysing)
MYEAAKRLGARVLFTGIGGDEWLDGRQEHLADLAAGLLLLRGGAGAARDLVDRAKDDWRVYSGAGRWPLFLARRLAAEAAPEWARFRRRKLRLLRHGIFSREFCRRVHLAERIFTVPESGTRRFSSRTQEATFRLVTAGYEAQVFEWNDREAASTGMEPRFPFFNRRLTEFCLRLPEDQRQRGAVWKRILRNAMRERLPDRVCNKLYKAEFSELFQNVISTPRTRVRLENLVMLRQSDWLDQDRFATHISSFVDSGRFWNLWGLLGVDLWLESVGSAGL